MYLKSCSKIYLVSFLLIVLEISSAFVPVASSTPLAAISTSTMRKNKGFYPTNKNSANIHARGGETKIHSSLVEFQNGPFWQSATIFTIGNVLGWVISLITGSHVHLDLIGTGIFAVASLPSLVGIQSIGDIFRSRTRLSGAMMTLWGTKLAGFLFFRALKTGHDARLDDLLSTASGATSFWFISLLWGFALFLAPHARDNLFGSGHSPHDTTRNGTLRDWHDV
mmetsp:Transcript_22633/g.34190  ORF Transcript_22633/g.34190 Transcript_22633/m.34190 type:complete len:224 (-) Transcript_22633:365-1036(-)